MSPPLHPGTPGVGSPAGNTQRWVWMYTCNFLTPGTYVTNASLAEMMGGAHILMGYGSLAWLSDIMPEAFANLLREGESIYDAYLLAGKTDGTLGNLEYFYQRILYIPQARYETIYSPYIHYAYDYATDVLFKTEAVRRTDT